MPSGTASRNRRALRSFAAAVVAAIATAAPAFAAAAPPEAAFPLAVSPDKRRLVDARGRPVLLNGEAAWSLVSALEREDAERYLETRRRQGFNAVIVNAIEHYFNGPTNRYGEAPFLAAGDFSRPNPKYFEHAEWVVRLAREKGFVVLLTPAYLGSIGGEQGWYEEVKSASTDAMRGYGRYLAARFKGLDNVVWLIGGDTGPGEARRQVLAMVAGLREGDGSRLYSAHNGRFDSGVTKYPGERWLAINTTYSDCDRAAAQAAADYRRSPAMPFVFIEGVYENEGVHDSRAAAETCVRSQAYWSVLAGATGHFFGSKPVWSFDTGWSRQLESPGAASMSRFAALFASRDWSALVPDTSGLTLLDDAGARDRDVATAALTADGTTLIAYTPVGRPLTVDLDRLRGATVRAWWYDPSGGAATPAGELPRGGRRAFAPPGPGDWVLVIDDASLGLPPPGAGARLTGSGAAERSGRRGAARAAVDAR